MNRPPFFEQFARWFVPSEITELARVVGWLVRRGKIDAFEFFAGLVFGQMSALRLTLSAQASCYSEPVQRQAVDQRYDESTVQFFRRGFDQCLQRSMEQAPPPSLTEPLAAYFNAVHLVDSTSFDCVESLAQIYPGCGGGASSANCKILLRYEYLHAQFQPLALLPGKRTDSGLAVELPPLVQANELMLFDKGFFKLQSLLEIDQKKAFFLTPMNRSAGLWVTNSQGATVKLDLVQALKETHQDVLEWSTVLLGSESTTLTVRVVAFRLTEQSASRHRAALRRAYVKKGGLPPAAALELAGWLILITNVPADKLPSLALAYLYRARWQIELIFKQCKSVLRLHLSEARKNPFRVQCEIWARLIGAVVLFAWHSHLQSAAFAKNEQEISFAQVASAFQQQGFMLTDLLITQGQRLLEALQRLWRRLLRTAIKGRQRSRKTTWEALMEHWLQFAHR